MTIAYPPCPKWDANPQWTLWVERSSFYATVKAVKGGVNFSLWCYLSDGLVYHFCRMRVLFYNPRHEYTATCVCIFGHYKEDITNQSVIALPDDHKKHIPFILTLLFQHKLVGLCKLSVPTNRVTWESNSDSQTLTKTSVGRSNVRITRGM